jgi:hypothetical protein
VPPSGHPKKEIMELVILYLFISVVTVEAITNLLTKSEFFLPVRKFFFDRKENRICNFVHDLLDCGYCTSVWIGFFVAVLYTKDVLINPFIIGIVLHRLANLFHHIIDRVWGKEEI